MSNKISANLFDSFLPNWIGPFLKIKSIPIHSMEDKMLLTIQLAEENARNGTGGPFGAAIFEKISGKLFSIGVNRVIETYCSVAHAEVLAISIAQQKLKIFDLSALGYSKYELFTSCEPCAMCIGLIHWSGIRTIVCGAREDDARLIGFDEGPKHHEWVEELENRGVSVLRDICRPQAQAALNRYKEIGGRIYNPAPC